MGLQDPGIATYLLTPGSFYPYTLDPAANVPNLVRTSAGPQATIGV